MELAELPDPTWVDRWDRILVPDGIKERLRNYMLFCILHRARLHDVSMPIHGLVILAGPPGTGKTTLASGLANRAALDIDGPLLFVDINPHAFPSQLLGESQRSVARLFERTLPDLARRGLPMVVLLDEVEALAVNRSAASLETNPVDVHRATAAVLAGVDRVARQCPNVTFVATTNHRIGVDPAFVSRADLVEEIGYPRASAIRAILLDTLRELTDQPVDEEALLALAETCAGIDLDARQVRKLVTRALLENERLARDPSGVTVADVAAAFAAARASESTAS